jgi:hypothetical protein
VRCVAVRLSPVQSGLDVRVFGTCGMIAGDYLFVCIERRDLETQCAACKL